MTTININIHTTGVTVNVNGGSNTQEKSNPINVPKEDLAGAIKGMAQECMPGQPFMQPQGFMRPDGRPTFANIPYGYVPPFQTYQDMQQPLYSQGINQAPHMAPSIQPFAPYPQQQYQQTQPPVYNSMQTLYSSADLSMYLRGIPECEVLKGPERYPYHNSKKIHEGDLASEPRHAVISILPEVNDKGNTQLNTWVKTGYDTWLLVTKFEIKEQAKQAVSKSQKQKVSTSTDLKLLNMIGKKVMCYDVLCSYRLIYAQEWQTISENLAAFVASTPVGTELRVTSDDPTSVNQAVYFKVKKLGVNTWTHSTVS